MTDVLDAAELLIVALMASVGGWKLIVLDRRNARIEGHLQALRQQVLRWQAAHDHQVGSMDRRMFGVEQAAARAEQEARSLSIQLVGADGLISRVERIEDWLARWARQGGVG